MEPVLTIELGICIQLTGEINNYCESNCILKNECNKDCPFYVIKSRSITEVTEHILIGKQITVIDINKELDKGYTYIRKVKEVKINRNMLEFSKKIVTISKINYNNTYRDFEIFIEEDNRENIWYSYLFKEFPVFGTLKDIIKNFCLKNCIYRSCGNSCNLKSLTR